MRNNSVKGVIEYVTDSVGVEGQEEFHITRHANGHRVLRATSKMYNDGLTRDTIVTVDAKWYPCAAHIHLLVEDTYVGSGHYVFSTDQVKFSGHNKVSGMHSETRDLADRAPAFGGHAVQNDAWMYAAFDQKRAQDTQTQLPGVVVTSKLPNGGDGPALLFSDQNHRIVGLETVRTRAGEFETRHYEFLFDAWPSIHYWITGDDYILVRCRWDLLKQTYELVSLSA